MIDVENIKKRMIDILKEKGPSLPIRIAKEVDMEPVFASAILGELTANKKVRTSNMKIGASHIYYVPGQEKKLEPFAEEHFNGVVKSAFLKIKDKKFLTDSEEEPAMRVALRSIKDFASPFNYKDRVMWRYNFLSKEEVIDLIEGRAPVKKEEPKANEKPKSPEQNAQPKIEEKIEERLIQNQVPKVESSTEKIEHSGGQMGGDIIKKNNSEETDFEDNESSRPEVESKNTEDNNPEEDSPEEIEESQNEQEESISEETGDENFESPFENAESEPKEEKPKYELTEEVLSYLKRRAFPLIEILEETRTEFMGTVRINSELGAFEYLVIAKTKKSLTDEDIRYCKGRATDKNMPCYILIRDKITKAGQNLLEDFKNLIRVDKL